MGSAGCSCVACNCTQSVRDEGRGDGCSCVACNCTQSIEQQCAGTETVGFKFCPLARDSGLRLAEHALAASRRCELTKSWVRLLSATVPMSGGFGLLYETVSVLVDPY